MTPNNWYSNLSISWLEQREMYIMPSFEKLLSMIILIIAKCKCSNDEIIWLITFDNMNNNRVMGNWNELTGNEFELKKELHKDLRLGECLCVFFFCFYR